MISCPSCDSRLIEDIDGNIYMCMDCGKTFTTGKKQYD